MPLSGKEMVRLYEKSGWIVTRQKGSHIQLSKTLNGITHNETIPAHKELNKGAEAKYLKRLKGV